MGQMVKSLPAMLETRLLSLGWEDPLEEGMQPTPVFLPGKSPGQTSLAGYNPWGCKDSDTTERLRTRMIEKTFAGRSNSFKQMFIFPFLNLFNWRLTALQASLVAQRLKHLPAMREAWVWSLGQEDPLEKEMATHSSILAWRIPWTEEPGGLQSTGSQRVRYNWATSLTALQCCAGFCHTSTYFFN